MRAILIYLVSYILESWILLSYCKWSSSSRSHSVFLDVLSKLLLKRYIRHSWHLLNRSLLVTTWDDAIKLEEHLFETLSSKVWHVLLRQHIHIRRLLSISLDLWCRFPTLLLKLHLLVVQLIVLLSFMFECSVMIDNVLFREMAASNDAPFKV